MRLTIFAVENQYPKNEIFWVCVCSFSYTARKAHAPCNVGISNLFSFTNFSPHYPIFATISEKRFEHKTYVFVSPWFDLQLDALNSCLFTYNTFIKLLYMFRALL